MAKVVYACSRRHRFAEAHERKLRQICARLEPDNLSLPATHTVAMRGTVAWAIANDRNCVVEDDSVLLGCLYGDEHGWEQPQARYPDGSYAMFRNSADRLEVVSDAAASRTVWYYFDDEYFVASTSQRAIVMFVGSFEFNEEVIPWVLSTGTLGPERSWDRRIRRLPPESSLLLDKQCWSIRVDREPVVFAPERTSRAAQEALLGNEIRAVVRSLNHARHVSFHDYVLPLSGGYDSRAILCFLREAGAPSGLRTITWGLEESAGREGNDAAVATELAARLGVAHRYFHTDSRGESIERVIDRFIQCGEGRVDHLSAYMDGCETWRRLLEEEGCAGIIRGDEGFGWVPVSSEAGVRLVVGLSLCRDFSNLEAVVEDFGLARQDLPEALRRTKRETLATWRDRLYHSYRLPTVLAALSDVKCSYVEVINPLLARSILHRVRKLPDRWRTNKSLFKRIVNAVSPKVPYANERATASPESLLRRKEVVELMQRELRSDTARALLDRRLLEFVLQGMRHQGPSGRTKQGRSWRSAIKFLLPRSMRTRIRELFAKPSLDGNVLAFRIFLVLRMHSLLTSDCVGVTAGEVPGRKAALSTVN